MGLIRRAFYESETGDDKMVKLQHYAVSNCYLAKQIQESKILMS